MQRTRHLLAHVVLLHHAPSNRLTAQERALTSDFERYARLCDCSVRNIRMHGIFEVFVRNLQLFMPSGGSDVI